MQQSHRYGKDWCRVLWGIAMVSFVPTGTLFFSTSEMEIGVEPVHRGGLWRLTSISPVTLSADTPRNIGHVLPWWLNTGSGLILQLSHTTRKNIFVAQVLLMHGICISRTRRNRVGAKDSTASGSYTLIPNQKTFCFFNELQELSCLPFIACPLITQLYSFHYI